jgi:undecaprenyl-diphosphatase
MHIHYFIAGFMAHLEALLQAGGYWILGFVAIVEVIPLIGSIIPGHTIIILGGFFAHMGILNVYVVLVVSALGAFVGDILSYLIGRKYGYDFIIKWGKYFLIKEAHIERAKAALHRHTGKALIIGRFTPITRPYMPFLVGAGRGSIHKFWIYDFIGCVLWAISSVALGYIFGASYKLVTHYIGQFTTMGLLIGGLLVFGYVFVNSRRHLFAKYDLHILFTALVSLYVFFKTIQDVLSVRPFMVALDVTINKIMADHAQPAFIFMMKLLSDIISPTTLSIAAVALLSWYIYKKYWHNAAIIFATYPTGLVLTLLLKDTIQRFRPLNSLITETDFSFPSGHSVAAALFFTLIIYFCTRHIKKRHHRELFILLNAFLILLVGFSRIYLNVHWFSDVIAGISFGVFWASLGILAVRYFEGLVTGRGSKKLV